MRLFICRCSPPVYLSETIGAAAKAAPQASFRASAGGGCKGDFRTQFCPFTIGLTGSSQVTLAHVTLARQHHQSWAGQLIQNACVCRRTAAELIVGSVTDTDTVLAATRSADWIFHTAALLRIQRSVDDPIGTHQVNVTGTLNVLCAAQRNGVRRVVNSSSSSVYGDQPTHLMREDMTPNPKSPYALQNLMGEQYADVFAHLHRVMVVRNWM